MQMSAVLNLFSVQQPKIQFRYIISKKTQIFSKKNHQSLFLYIVVDLSTALKNKIAHKLIFKCYNEVRRTSGFYYLIVFAIYRIDHVQSFIKKKTSIEKWTERQMSNNYYHYNHRSFEVTDIVSSKLTKTIDDCLFAQSLFQLSTI